MHSVFQRLALSSSVVGRRALSSTRRQLNPLFKEKLQQRRNVVSHGWNQALTLTAAVGLGFGWACCDPEVSPVTGEVKHYEYVIIGTGTAAHAATEVILQTDPRARILIVREDMNLPRLDVEGENNLLDRELSSIYNRWRRHISCDLHTIVGKPEKATEAQIHLEVGLSKMDIDVEGKTICFQSGSKISYSKCLLADPGKPKQFYVIDSHVMAYSLTEHVNTLKDAMDFRLLEATLRKGGQRICVVGGGFLGTETVAALAELNTRLGMDNVITHVFVENFALDRYLPEYLCKHVLNTLRGLGVRIMRTSIVSGVQRAEDENGDSEDCIRATLMVEGERKEYDYDYLVLASTHVDPQVEVASNCGLEIDPDNGGVMVNEALQAYEGVFVAGDSASYYNSILGRRRVDDFDHAMNSGLCCGQNMAAKDGKVYRYNHQPTFISSIAGSGRLLECVGDVDASLRTVGVWIAKRDEASGTPNLEQTEYGRGIVYYIKDSTVVGIMCVNASECLEAAKEVLKERKTVKDDASKQLKAKILLAPADWLIVKDSNNDCKQICCT